LQLLVVDETPYSPCAQTCAKRDDGKAGYPAALPIGVIGCRLK
jgi:hypothetical protein